MYAEDGVRMDNSLLKEAITDAKAQMMDELIAELESGLGKNV